MSAWRCLLILAFVFAGKSTRSSAAEDEAATHLPVVITTWAFVAAAREAWKVVDEGGIPLDAVVAGCSTCEKLRCDLSVGYGGSPDEAGETTLDAMIMDGTTINVGAVGALRSVKDAIRAAKFVLDYSDHTFLVGDQASAFALSMGVCGPANLSTPDSLQVWSTWKNHNCQPNYRKNVVPDANTSCGPYKPAAIDNDEQCLTDPHWPSKGYKHNGLKAQGPESSSATKGIGFSNHDTISMAVIDRQGKIAVGTSTNGLSYKIPGRVGDGPIAGAASYADDDVGACGATGDGDVMMRFLPCYQVVESMRLGKSPGHAAQDAIDRIKRKYPTFVGAVFAVDKLGNHAGACHGWIFQYSVRSRDMEDVEVYTVSPIQD